jgi:hypothetical protein
MEQLHCLGAHWQAEVVSIFGRDANGATRTLLFATGDEIALAADGPRRCIGAMPPGAEHRQRCPDQAEIEHGEQCERCIQLSQLLPCMICTGERCANPARRKSCIQPANHAVYLAAYAPNMLKVGVARWERRTERLAEQGARAALIIGRADGREARQLESAIKWLGAGRRKRGLDAGSAHRHERDSQAVPDRLSPSERLAAWSSPFDIPSLQEELALRLTALKRRVPSYAWLPEAEPVELPPLPTLAWQPRLLAADDKLRLRGTIVGCYGQTLIVENDLDELVALLPEKLAGLRLRELDLGEQGEEQISLALLGEGH